MTSNRIVPPRQTLTNQSLKAVRRGPRKRMSVIGVQERGNLLHLVVRQPELSRRPDSLHLLRAASTYNGARNRRVRKHPRNGDDPSRNSVACTDPLDEFGNGQVP